MSSETHLKANDASLCPGSTMRLGFPQATQAFSQYRRHAPSCQDIIYSCVFKSLPSVTSAKSRAVFPARVLRQIRRSILQFCCFYPFTPGLSGKTRSMSGLTTNQIPQQAFNFRAQAVIPSRFAPAGETSYLFDVSSITPKPSRFPNCHSPCLFAKR